MIKFKRIDYNTFQEDFRKCFSAVNPENDELIEIKEEAIQAAYDNIKLPEVGNDLVAYNLYSPVNFILGAGYTGIIPTGIEVESDEDIAILITPTEELSINNQLTFIGKVLFKDNEHIKVNLLNDWLKDELLSLKIGDTCAQLTILNISRVKEEI